MDKAQLLGHRTGRALILISRLRFPLLAVALFTLVAAVWAGLVRIGWFTLPAPRTLVALHGPLMVSGFLGTLISLERAVALANLGHRRAYAAPILSALGAIATLLGFPVGPYLLTLGSAALILIFAEIVRRQPASFTYTMSIGAILWTIGNLLWMAGWPVFHVVWWWAGYLILTIAGERLELARLTRFPRYALPLFGALIGVYVLGLLVLSLTPLAALGTSIIGLGAFLLALWLLRFDLARKTVLRTGLTRFIAVNLLTGYVWLLVSGVIILIAGPQAAGPLYDAELHTIFLGFVFGVIFGHAPVIFPAVLGRPMRYTPFFYVHVGLLHLSLILRIAGDLTGQFDVRRWGGMLNAFSLLLFLVVTVLALRSPRHATYRLRTGSSPLIFDRPFQLPARTKNQSICARIHLARSEKWAAKGVQTRMKIVTDCAADMPQAELETLGVTQAPLYIQFPEGEVSSADLTADQFYDRLDRMRPGIPTTAQPSGGIFAEIYREVLTSGEPVLSVHISSGLSGTPDAARLGSEMAGAQKQVTIWDTMTLSGGQRYQVLVAALAARKGWTLEQIEARLVQLRDQTEVIFTLDTLEYLAKGGRIGRVQALAGTLLHLKPVISVDHHDGKYNNVGRARTLPKALQTIATHLHQIYGETPLWVTVMHGRFAEQAEALAGELNKVINVGKLETLRVSPVLGVHTGPGVVGAAVAPMKLLQDLT